MTALATEDELQTLKRAELREWLTSQLAQLPPRQGLAMAVGIYIGVAKRHGLTLEKSIEALRATWAIDHESGPVFFKEPGGR